MFGTELTYLYSFWVLTYKKHRKRVRDASSLTLFLLTLYIMPTVLNTLIKSIVSGLRPMHLAPMIIVYYVTKYYYQRYTSPLANTPLAPATHFLVKYFGLVPPPNDAETSDTLSEFLIHTGRDTQSSPINVCWSVTGKPLVFANTLKGIKDILLDGQGKSKDKSHVPKVQRGDLIRLIQNLVFGGKNLNNTIGEVNEKIL